MKNYKHLGLMGLFFLFFFQSCEDTLDIQPNSSLIADTAFQTVDDLQNALNSAYLNYNNSTIQFNSIFTDNTRVGVDSGGQELTLHGLVLDPTSGVSSGIWVSRYAMINKVNRILVAVETMEIEDSEQARVDNILGQAYALRAFAHFELFQYFTPDYLDQSGLSVPAVEDVVTVENRPRNTVAEVYSLMESDLNVASSLLSGTSNGVEYITPDFITALRARMALFSGNYDAAEGFADQLIAKYPLANQEEYLAMFLDQNDTEVIFKHARVLGNARPGYIWNFLGFGPYIEMSRSLFMELDPDDVRYEANLKFPESDPDDDLLIIGKYPGNAVEALSDVKVFRVSEMYLIKAEAQIRRGDIGESKETLKELRDARFGTETALPDYTGTADGLNFLIEERRIELAFESHRWLDLKRFGKPLERLAEDCQNLDNACSIAVGDRRFTMPIPLVEMNANPEMVQNPGYN